MLILLNMQDTIISNSILMSTRNNSAQSFLYLGEGFVACFNAGYRGQTIV